MLLHELFSPGQASKNVVWKYESGNQLGGATYSVDVKAGDGKIAEYGLNFAASYAKGVFEVSFVLHTDDGSVSMEITGTGKEFAVFSGMAEATRDFIRRNGRMVDALYFTAKEPSRARAYQHMAKRMAKELGWTENQKLASMFGGGWEAEGDPVPFMIVRPGSEDRIARSIMGDDE
jgi:hypothetical protein